MRTSCFGPFQGRAQGRRNGTRTWGGGVYHHPTAYTAGFVRAFGATPDSPSRASGDGLDGSDPPLFDRWRGQSRGGVYHPVYHRVYHHPSPWGSLPSYVSLQEGSQADARGGRSAPPRRAMRDALIRAFLVVGGISAVAGRGPRGRSRGRARPLPHAERVHRRRRLVLPRAGRGRVPHRPIPHQHVADLVRPDGRQVGAPVAPSRVAAFAYGGRPGNCRRGGPSPGQSHRDPEPRMADDPRRRPSRGCTTRSPSATAPRSSSSPSGSRFPSCFAPSCGLGFAARRAHGRPLPRRRARPRSIRSHPGGRPRRPG